VGTELGVFEAFYGSFVQHPLLLWLAVVLGLGFALTRPGLPPSLRLYCIGLAALSAADAWLTSSPIPALGSLSGAAASLVPLFFVLAGDLRFLFVVQLADASGGLRFEPRRVALAVALVLVVPAFSELVVASLPEALSAPRVMFLVYEVSFFALTLALLAWHPRMRGLAWTRGVARFVLLYYGLWATADTIILFGGADWGFALRVVPNLLYYGGLIAVIAGSASAGRGEVDPG
jgi:hypothetical protein